MPSSEAFDKLALKIVYHELQSTLLNVSAQFESYTLTIDDVSSLEQAIIGLDQSLGALTFVNLPCAFELTELIKLFLTRLKEHPHDFSVSNLKPVGHALIGLICYLNFLQHQKQHKPLLLLPFSNEIKMFLGHSLRFEYALNGVEPAIHSAQTSILLNEGKNKLLLNMAILFRLCLVDVLKDKRIKPNLEKMARAANRIWTLTESIELMMIWNVVQAFADNKLRLDYNRKRYLAKVDLNFHTIKSVSAQASQLMIDEDCLKESLYLASLCPVNFAKTKFILDHYNINTNESMEKSLYLDRLMMTGPDEEVVGIVKVKLKEDLENIKLQLEQLSTEQDEVLFNDIVAAVNRLNNIASTLKLEFIAAHLTQLCSALEGQLIPFNNEQLAQIATQITIIECMFFDLSARHLFSTEQAVYNDELISSINLLQAQTDLTQLISSELDILKSIFEAFVESNFLSEKLSEFKQRFLSLQKVLDLSFYGQFGTHFNQVFLLIDQIPKANEIIREECLAKIADCMIYLEIVLEDNPLSININNVDVLQPELMAYSG